MDGPSLSPMRLSKNLEHPGGASVLVISLLLGSPAARWIRLSDVNLTEALWIIYFPVEHAGLNGFR